MPEVHISIGPAVLREVDVTELQSHLQHLATLFREHTDKILPRELTQAPQAHYLIRLSKKLAAVEQCDGFEEHLKLYREGTARAAR